MQAAVQRIPIGPPGLHAFIAAALALFAGFLYIFNFTGFLLSPDRSQNTMPASRQRR